MTMPHAQITNPQVCPMVTGVVPHVGGIIAPPGAVTALIGKQPCAQETGLTICVGPPGVIAMGSFKTLTGKMPAARLGSLTAHGGTGVMGCPLVLVG